MSKCGAEQEAVKSFSQCHWTETGSRSWGRKDIKPYFIIYYLSSFSLASAHAHGGRSAAEATLREVESCIKHFLPDLLQMLQ